MSASPSLIDRLIDASLGVCEPQPARLESVVGDVEDLLNTCCSAGDASLDVHPEAARSLLTYGSPAPASLAISTYEERQSAARQMTRVIRQFEPRLVGVRVHVEEAGATSNEGRFCIQAALRDAPESRIAWTLRVRNTSGRTQVTAERP